VKSFQIGEKLGFTHVQKLLHKLTSLAQMGHLSFIPNNLKSNLLVTFNELQIVAGLISTNGSLWSAHETYRCVNGKQHKIITIVMGVTEKSKGR